MPPPAAAGRASPAARGREPGTAASATTGLTTTTSPAPAPAAVSRSAGDAAPIPDSSRELPESPRGLASPRGEKAAPIVEPGPIDGVAAAPENKPLRSAPSTSGKPVRPAAASPAVPQPVAAVDERAADLPLALQLAKVLLPLTESKLPRPAFLSAQRISGIVDRQVLAEEDAELRKGRNVLTADRLTYWPADDEVHADGSVRIEQGEDVISGPMARLKLEDQVGFFDQATYFLKRQPKAAGAGQSGQTSESLAAAGQVDGGPQTGFAPPRVLGIKPGQTEMKAEKPAYELTEARGEAARLDLEGENQYHLTSATYTTCKPGNDDWYLSFADLQLDYDNEVGKGEDATVHFLGVPILHSPWASFSLNNERKSGFLIPRYGSSTESGIELVLPYYWNIAPNLDATIESRLLTKRGVQLGADVRYLNTAFGGVYRSEAVGEFLPDDRETNTNRWAVGFKHNQTTATGFAATIDYTRVSDNDYYANLSNQITSTSQTQLLQQGVLSYGGGGWWNVTTTMQSFQTLQPDPQNPVTKPYRLLPQVTVNARQPDLFSSDMAFFGQYTNFVQPDASQVEGQRSVVQPQISLPYVTPGWYVIPRVGVNFTHYDLSYPGNVNVLPTSINRTLPIASVDSGMIFERSSNWFGRDYTQTLEPRLFYLNIPYQNQNNIPIFDTALADFNFAQIFADNQFSGWDRINNANQLTAAVSSRLIDPSSGSEIMRAMIGEVFYFSNNMVFLPGTTNPKWSNSDLLAAFTGQFLPRLYADVALQYDFNDQRWQRFSIGARYLPEPGKLLNAGYRYNVDAATPINEVDISGQWPISGRWQAVGRYNYSFINSTPVEIIGGLEYNAGCWSLRTVAHRIQTAQNTPSTQFLVQLDLHGLSSIGTNPLAVLQRRIPGYAVGPVVTDPALAEW